MDKTKYLFNVINLGINVLIWLLPFFINILIIHHLYCNRLKQKDKTIFCLLMNIYPLILICTTLTIVFNIQMLFGDLYGIIIGSTWCIFTAYSILVIVGMLYCAFVHQAVYRLCRIVYPNFRPLQNLWLYVILSPIELIFMSILICPILFWHAFIYPPIDYFCITSFTNLRSVIWEFIVIYGIPLILLSLIYLRIIIFLRHQSSNQAVVVRKRQQRDLLILRRIYTIVGLLLLIGLPALLLIVVYNITGQEIPLKERIIWLAVSLSMGQLSIGLVIVTPQLKRIVLKRFQHNLIVPFNTSTARANYTHPVLQRH